MLQNIPTRIDVDPAPGLEPAAEAVAKAIETKLHIINDMVEGIRHDIEAHILHERDEVQPDLATEEDAQPHVSDLVKKIESQIQNNYPSPCDLEKIDDDNHEDDGVNNVDAIDQHPAFKGATAGWSSQITSSPDVNQPRICNAGSQMQA